ncbi:MAG: glycosyltransferase family 9 protein [Candidatus Aminicenantales bacterium]
MKILVRMPNWLGDSVLALPALRAIAMNFPQSAVWAAASSHTVELLAAEPIVAGVLEIPEVMTLSDFIRTAKRWREHRFDLAILLTNSFGSALLAALAAIQARWGYAGDARSPLLTKRVSRYSRPERRGLSGAKGESRQPAGCTQGSLPFEEEEGCHQSLYYLRLLRSLGLKVPDEPAISISVTNEERESAKKQLASVGLDLKFLEAEKKPLILINPGAAYGPAKRWSAEKFGQVAASFEKQAGAYAAIIGSAREREIAQEVVEAAVASGAKEPPFILAGKTTLRELIGVMSLADLLVTNDTGPMHLANALRLPIVAIFGPTDPRVTRPWHEPYKILHNPVVCWPCWYRECPYDHRCMEAIGTEEVVNAGLALLGQAPAGKDQIK